MNDYVRELDELRPTGFRAHDTHRLNQLFSTQNKKEVSKSAKGARQAHLLSSTLARELDLCARAPAAWREACYRGFKRARIHSSLWD